MRPSPGPSRRLIPGLLLLLITIGLGSAAAREPLGDRSTNVPLGDRSAGVPAPAAPSSPLEALYRDRSGEPLETFGYALFEAAGHPTPSRAPVAAVPGAYRLGPGDRLRVTLRGAEPRDWQAAIGRDGTLTLPELRPLPAAGRPLDELRAELAAAVAARYRQPTEVFVAVTRLREVGVLVTGAVRRPGPQRLSSVATVLDALLAAGGIDRGGSLRGIRLVRGGASHPIDLYALLRGTGSTADLTVEDGDRLLVPALGPTIAVAGAARAPGIYELPPERGRISPAAAIRLAGGALRPGPLRLLRLAYGPDGAERATAIDDAAEPCLGDGDILRVAPVAGRRRDTVYLDGHVAVPGPYARAGAGSVAALLAEPGALAPGAYRPFAALLTRDRGTGAARAVPLDLAAVLDGRGYYPLGDEDRLVVLSEADVAFLSAAPVLAVLRGEPPSPARAARCPGLVALARAVRAEAEGPLGAGALSAAARRLAPSGVPCPAVFRRFPELLPLALAHAVVVVEGVRRPGLYPTAAALPPAALASLAGGPGDGPGEALGFRPASAVVAAPARPGGSVRLDTPGVRLTGHVRLPGARPLARTPDLAALLDGGRALAQDTYPLLGVIVRRDPATLERRILAFSPRAVLGGRPAPGLRAGDTVTLFSRTGLAERLDAGADRVAPPDRPPPPPQLDLGPMPAIPVAADANPAGVAADANPAATAATQPGPVLADRRLAAAVDRFLEDAAVSLDGAVVLPGRYPVVPDTSLYALLDAAGGLTGRADRRRVEILARGAEADGTFTAARTEIDLARHPAADIMLRPGDRVRVHALFDPLDAGTVAIRGEVRRPGHYRIVRGERLSDLIARAGGLTDEAYPAGAVFTRAQARAVRAQELRAAADRLDSRLAAALASHEPPREAEIARARALAARLRAAEPPGRIVVEADPQALGRSPELDLVLQAGDAVHYPRRPLTVRVAGEVLAPAALQFRDGKTPREYLREAGGLARGADRSRVFVLYPDGSAEPLAVASWNHRPVFLPPGSTIVVPRDPEPFDFLALSESLTGVLGNLAISAATIVGLAE